MDRIPVDVVCSEDQAVGERWNRKAPLQGAAAGNQQVVDMDPDGGSSNGFSRANLCVGPVGPARMTVRNTEVRDSSKWGIYLGEGELVTENDTSANNATGDVRRSEGG